MVLVRLTVHAELALNYLHHTAGVRGRARAGSKSNREDGFAGASSDIGEPPPENPTLMSEFISSAITELGLPVPWCAVHPRAMDIPVRRQPRPIWAHRRTEDEAATVDLQGPVPLVGISTEQHEATAYRRRPELEQVYA